MLQNNVKDIFLTDDIFPLGKFETIPVKPIRNAEAESYPNVTILKENVEYEILLEEAYKHIECVGNNYVKPRLSHINKEIDENTLRTVLSDVGFCIGTYQSFSLRKQGTNILEDWVSKGTRQFFNSLPVNVFRQQYAVAYPRWSTKLHRDHKNFKMHGFRAMVPLNSDVYMGFEDDNKNNLVYKLSIGNMYFVNIAKMHRGFNESTTDSRINLIMQMDSDSMVLNGKELKPLDQSEVALLPNYARDYDVWEFGYEL